MFKEDPETFPFWTERQAELGLIRIGLIESYLECLNEDLVGMEWLVRQGVVRKGDAIAQLHTARGSTSLKAPFAMEIVTVNDEVVQDPRLLRDSPYYEGWMAEVRHRT